MAGQASMGLRRCSKVAALVSNDAAACLWLVGGGARKGRFLSIVIGRRCRNGTWGDDASVGVE